MAGQSIFISYRREDAGGHARSLHEHLRGRFGDDRVFFDRSTIESGDIFPDKLRQGIEGCAVLLALIGPEWLDVRDRDGRRRLDDANDFVRREIALALERGKKVIPVLFDDTPVPPRDKLPDSLKALADCDALTLHGKTYEYEAQLGELDKILDLPGTWEDLRDICKDITHRRMAAVRRKHDKELYLQRNTMRQHVEAFLEDREKRGFILVGKSGVGKSNFLLALAEELHARSNVCVLLYDGANPITSSALTDIIGKDLKDLRLSRQPVRQVWEEIARIDGMGERKVVFCVDAVNENARATDLLRQLDELVQSPWPWLKIIFTARPETWGHIKRGVKLAEELYYREPKGEMLGIELEPFSYSEKMEPFSSHAEVGIDGSPSLAELPQVYSKYAHKFNLQTHYDGLSYEVREILRDPLHLLLLAKTYKGKTVPATMKPSNLIKEYVIAYVQWEELRFLEKEVVAMMMRDGHYSDMITEAALDATGGALYEMIYNNHKNQAFLALCDADILVLEEQQTEERLKEQRIRFKYERFYEYFAGERLAVISEGQNDLYAFFVTLIEETTGKPFFWGAVRNALAEEAGKLSSETILKLCRATEQQRIKEMMVDVLITLGLDSPEQVGGLLRNLIPQEKQAREWQKIRYLVSKSAAEADPRTRNARKIAIEVASTLKLGSILQTAALHTDPTMRAMAVRYAYYLWQHDQAGGFAVLQYLAEEATTGLIPNSLGLESIFGLSLIIVCASYQDEEALSTLQGIWHGMVAKLFLRQHDSRWKGVVRDFIRERIISLVIAHVFSLLRQLPPNNMMNYDALEAFFKLQQEDKQLYRRLVSYFDVNEDYPREQMEQDYLAVLKLDNVLLRLATTMGLIAHAWAAPHAFLPFLKRLFEAAKSNIATYPYLRAIHNVPISLLQREPKKMSDEIFAFFVDTATVSQECYTQHPKKYQGEGNGPPPQAPGIGSYINFQYRREGTVKTPWLEIRIQKALKELDLKLFEFLLSAEFPDQAINHQAPKAVLAALELFFKSGNAEITDKIQAFLSRLRLYYPDQVEDFLEEQQASDEFRLQVRTHEPSERVGDLIGMRAWYFVRDSALLGPAKRRAQLIVFFEKAAECKDTRAWMNFVIRHLVNLIYGGQAVRERA